MYQTTRSEESENVNVHINRVQNLKRGVFTGQETFFRFFFTIGLKYNKGKVYPKTGCEGPEAEYMYSFALVLTSALDGCAWSRSRPGRFTPGKETRYTLYRRLGGPQDRYGRVRKISPPPGFVPRNVQPLASRYTG